MTTPKIRLLGWRVLVRLNDSKVSPGGIQIPELSEVSKREGVVAGLGDGRVNDTDNILPFPVTIGDRVVLGPYASFEYEENGQHYVVCATQDVIGILP